MVGLVDELDVGGPAAAVDVKRLSTTMTAALTRRDGAYIWRAGEDAKSKIQAVDGSEMRADALAPFDVVGLANATGAPNVRFDLATGVSSTRRKGGLISTEIIIEMAGLDHLGKPLRTRHGVVHPQGQMPVTGLGIAMVLEQLTGVDGQPPTPPGLYFPYQLIDHSAYLTRFEQSGGSILQLELT